jgi:hypothetical protein
MGYVPYGYIAYVPINTKFSGIVHTRCKRRKFKNVGYTDMRMRFMKKTSQSWEMLMGRDYKCVAEDQKGKSLLLFQTTSGKQKENNVLVRHFNQFPLENESNIDSFFIITAFSFMSCLEYAQFWIFETNATFLLGT